MISYPQTSASLLLIQSFCTNWQIGPFIDWKSTDERPTSQFIEDTRPFVQSVGVFPTLEALTTGRSIAAYSYDTDPFREVQKHHLSDNNFTSMFERGVGGALFFLLRRAH